MTNRTTKVEIDTNINIDAFSYCSPHMRILLRQNLKNKLHRNYIFAHFKTYNSLLSKREYTIALNLVYKYDNMFVRFSRFNSKKPRYPNCDFFKTIVNDKPLIIIRFWYIDEDCNKIELSFLYDLIQHWNTSKTEFCVMLYKQKNNSTQVLFNDIKNYIKSIRPEMEMGVFYELFHHIQVNGNFYFIVKKEIRQDLYNLCESEIDKRIWKSNREF